MEQLLRGAYLSLIAWQLAWLGLLQPPHGPGRPWLGLVSILPLLLTIKGVLKTDPRGINWASYLLLAYLIVGITECWSNPEQRLAASVQLALAATCLLAIGAINYRRGRSRATPR